MSSQYPDHVLQSVLVPRDRPDVRDSVSRARKVAERYGARPGGKVERQANFFAFRQFDPAHIQKGSYISFKSPGGVVIRKGLPIGARDNPSSEGPGLGTWLALGAAAAVGIAIIGSRAASAAIVPNPDAPAVPPGPRPTPQPPAPPTPTPTFVRQAVPLISTSRTAVRVMQQQLKDLGYHITSVDGDFGPETTAAAASFIAHQGLSADTTNLELMLAVDTQYAYFFDTRGGLRSV